MYVYFLPPSRRDPEFPPFGIPFFITMNNESNSIQRAVTEISNVEHLQFRKLRFASEYFQAKKTRSSLKRILRRLHRLANRHLKKYCSQLSKRLIPDISLNTYSTLQSIIIYYEIELTMVDAVIQDYWSYIREGNFISAFIFQKERL